MTQKLKTPDVPKLSLIGVLIGGVPIVAQLLEAFGLYGLSHVQQQAIENTLGWAQGLGAAIIAADVWLRSQRAKHLGAQIPVDPPIGDPSRPPDDSGVTDDTLTPESDPVGSGSGAVPDEPS